MCFFILVLYYIQGQLYRAKDSCIGWGNTEVQYHWSKDIIQDQYEKKTFYGTFIIQLCKIRNSLL